MSERLVVAKKNTSVPFFFFKTCLGVIIFEKHIFDITPGGSRCFFWKSRLGRFASCCLSHAWVPVLVLLHPCLWAGVFVLLNSRLGAPLFFIHASGLVFFFEITPGRDFKKPNTGAPERDFKKLKHQPRGVN